MSIHTSSSSIPGTRKLNFKMKLALGSLFLDAGHNRFRLTRRQIPMEILS